MQRTTNLDLILPSGEDYVNVDEQISGNFQKIDDGYGVLNSKLETVEYDEIKDGNTLLGFVNRCGKVCIINMNNNNGSIGTDGITLPSKYTADSDYYSACKYFNGSSDVIGFLFMAYNTNVLRLRNISGTNVSGSFITGTLTYFAKN